MAKRHGTADRATTIARQKRVRQEALREQLAAGKHVEGVLELLDKIGDEEEEVPAPMLERYKVVLTHKMKLINKYLPDVKQVEITEGVSTDDLSDEELEAAIRALEQGAEG